MLKVLDPREAEAMSPQAYAAEVSGEDYAEYAERTESDYVAYDARLDNHKTALLIRKMLEDSVATGNAANNTKRFLFYGKDLPDLETQAWWAEGVEINHLNDVTPEKLAWKAKLSDPLVRRLIHVGAGLQTEASEFNEAIYKHIFEGAPLDTVNLGEEAGDVLWYVGILCRAIGVSLTALLRNNIAKLFQRFRGKFCYDRVGNRDLAGERAVLEDLK